MPARTLLVIAPFFIVKYIISPKSSYAMSNRDGIGSQIASSFESSAVSEEEHNEPPPSLSATSVGLHHGILTENANEPIIGASYLATGLESARQARGRDQSSTSSPGRRETPKEIESMPLKDVFAHVGDEIYCK
jgi:hypothetical protein